MVAPSPPPAHTHTHTHTHILHHFGLVCYVAWKAVVCTYEPATLKTPPCLDAVIRAAAQILKILRILDLYVDSCSSLERYRGSLDQLLCHMLFFKKYVYL